MTKLYALLLIVFITVLPLKTYGDLTKQEKQVVTGYVKRINEHIDKISKELEGLEESCDEKIEEILKTCEEKYEELEEQLKDIEDRLEKVE